MVVAVKYCSKEQEWLGVFECLSNSVVSLLGVEGQGLPLPKVVEFDEDEHLQQLERHLRNVALSYAKNALVYSKMQCPELWKAPFWKQAYTCMSKQVGLRSWIP